MQTDIYKQKLEEEQAKLTNELSSFAVKEAGITGDWDAVRAEDPGAVETGDEVAEQLENMNERKATEGPLEKRLNLVNLALSKIAEGKYGQCEISGEPIEEDRLQANPAARTCKAHMNEEENLPI